MKSKKHSLLNELQSKPKPANKPSHPAGNPTRGQSEPFDTARALAGVPEGERDDTLFRLACSLRSANEPEEKARELIIKAARNCIPPFDDKLALQKVANVYNKYPAGHNDQPYGTPQNQRAFCGFNSIDQVRAKLGEVDPLIHADKNLGAAYEDGYVAAAAALEHFEPAEYLRLRNKLKDRGVSISNWEKAVGHVRRREEDRIAQEARIAKAEAAANQPGMGQIVDLADPTPHDQPVDGALLAEDIAATIRRFVKVSQPAVIAITLWILFTYLIDLFDIAPRLAITSPDKRCGKSTLLELIMYLVRRGLAASNISNAAVYRVIEMVKPTLLIDEMDTVVKPGKNDGARAEELRGILNSGHTRELAFVIRMEKVGDRMLPCRFSTFAPIVQALIGRLPPTLADRSIAIAMQRKLKSEKVEKLGGRKKRVNRATFDALTRRAERWRIDNSDAVAQALPDLAAGLDDRASDNWEVLLQIAHVIGGGWPELARKASSELSGGNDDGIGVRLLGDIRDVFVSLKADRLSSKALCGKLGQIETSPWGHWGRMQVCINESQLAGLLKPFGILPATIRLSDKKTPKGYHVEWFRDAFERYPAPPSAQKPPETTNSPATPPQPNGERENSDFVEAPQPRLVAARKSAVQPTVGRTVAVLRTKNAKSRLRVEKGGLEGGDARLPGPRVGVDVNPRTGRPHKF